MAARHRLALDRALGTLAGTSDFFHRPGAADSGFAGRHCPGIEPLAGDAVALARLGRSPSWTRVHELGQRGRLAVARRHRGHGGRVSRDVAPATGQFFWVSSGALGQAVGQVSQFAGALGALAGASGPLSLLLKSLGEVSHCIGVWRSLAGVGAHFALRWATPRGVRTFHSRMLRWCRRGLFWRRWLRTGIARRLLLLTCEIRDWLWLSTGWCWRLPGSRLRHAAGRRLGLTRRLARLVSRSRLRSLG